MTSSLWKMPQLLGAIFKTRTSGLNYGFGNGKLKKRQSVVLTSHRGASLSPDDVGQVLHLHNGVRYVPFKVTYGMVGYKCGAFVNTKKRVIHKKKKTKKSK